MEKPKQYRLLTNYGKLKAGAITLPKFSVQQAYRIPLELGGEIVFPLKTVENNPNLFELIEIKTPVRKKIKSSKMSLFKTWWKQL